MGNRRSGRRPKCFCFVNVTLAAAADGDTVGCPHAGVGKPPPRVAAQGKFWVEHSDWLAPLFNEHLALKDRRIGVSVFPDLGLSLSEQALAWIPDAASWRPHLIPGAKIRRPIVCPDPYNPDC
jgi:hypothetical protein